MQAVDLLQGLGNYEPPEKAVHIMSEMTLNDWMMVESYPNLKEEVDGSIPSCEISFLLDGKLARWSIASCALAMAC